MGTGASALTRAAAAARFNGRSSLNNPCAAVPSRQGVTQACGIGKNEGGETCGEGGDRERARRPRRRGERRLYATTLAERLGGTTSQPAPGSPPSDGSGSGGRAGETGRGAGRGTAEVRPAGKPATATPPAPPPLAPFSLLDAPFSTTTPVPYTATATKTLPHVALQPPRPCRLHRPRPRRLAALVGGRRGLLHAEHVPAVPPGRRAPPHGGC